MRSSFRYDIGPRASFASPSIFMTPSDPQPFRMTVVIHELGKFLGSSTFRPFTSLKLWRTLKSFKSCGWTLLRRSRGPSSTWQMLVPEWCLGFSFFFWCFETSSPELSMDELRCRFVLGDEGAVAGGGDGLIGGESNGSGGSGSLFLWYQNGYQWWWHGSLGWCWWWFDNARLFWRWRGGMRVIWSWRRFALLVQPLFEFKKFFQISPGLG